MQYQELIKHYFVVYQLLYDIGNSNSISLKRSPRLAGYNGPVNYYFNAYLFNFWQQ